MYHDYNIYQIKTQYRTRRMKQMAYETEEVGNQTINNLYDQGEQLNRIEGGLDKVNNNLSEAEDEMREMEKTCGCCTCPWDRRSEFSGSESKQFRKSKYYIYYY